MEFTALPVTDTYLLNSRMELDSVLCGGGYVYPRGFGETEEDREEIVQWLINLVNKYEKEEK